MLIGYMRVSTPSVRGADGKLDLEEAANRERQLFDLQHDALLKAGIKPERIYQDRGSGKREDRPPPDGSLRPLGEKLLVRNGKVTVRASAVVLKPGDSE
jgi:hypothetical protein